MDKVTTVGIDLAKNVFSLHGVDTHGHVVLQRTVTRSKLLEVVAGLPPCVIGMEASMGAHHWARQFAQFGHTARLMAARFVAPYRKSGKNDGNDAAAICEAVSRPSMRNGVHRRPVSKVYQGRADVIRLSLQCVSLDVHEHGFDHRASHGTTI